VKLTIEKLQEAQELASQRVFLAQEHAKLTTTDPVVKAVARVTFEPRRAGRSRPVEVEITENKHGSIADDILACIIANVSRRIEDLDRRLADLGIEIEDEAA
jgi:hypothetical protein